MMLEPRDPVLYFVQRLRDEAHRFAIGTHRAKRAKAIGANPLDEIPGIGPARKRALLKHFRLGQGGRRAPARRTWQAVEGISAQMAQAIYDFFHERLQNQGKSAQTVIPMLGLRHLTVEALELLLSRAWNTP